MDATWKWECIVWNASGGQKIWLASQFLPTGKKDEKNTLLQVDTILMFAQSEQSRTEAAKIIEYDAWREWVSPLSDLEIG